MTDKKHHWSFHLTTLANERTFLAYIRTSLTLFVAGVSFVEFFTYPIVVKIGLVFVVFGIITFLIGLFRFLKTRSHIDNASE